MPLNVAVIIGSLRKDSLNRHLAQEVMKLNAPDLAFHELPIADLPFYNQDFEAAPPAPVTAFRDAVVAADAFLIISPEYNRSLPAAVKNAIDVASRPMGQNRWQDKPVGVFGSSTGAIGTAAMQQLVRPGLAAVRAPGYAGPEVYLHAGDGFFTPDGALNDGTRGFLQGWMDGFSAFAKMWAAQKA